MHFLIVKIFFATCVGVINACHGAGIKWGRQVMIFILPFSMYIVSGDPIKALIFLTPLSIYFWDTGGLQQTYIKENINDAKGKQPFDTIATWLTNILYDGDYHDLRTDGTWCRSWGFFYTLQVSLIFTIPFLYTNYAYSAILLSLPIIARYLLWRKVEFLWFFIYSLSYSIS